MAGGVESVIITITLSLAGVVWSVISYTLFTKWLCCRSVALKDRLLNYFTEKCSKQRDSTEELQIMPREEARDFETSYIEATSTMDEEYQNGNSEQNHMMDDSSALGEGNLMNESRLLDGEQHGMEDQGEGGQSGELDDQAESDDSEESPLIGGHKLIMFFTVLQIIAKPIVLAVNIVYLVESISESNQVPIFFFDVLGNENSDPELLQLVVQAFAEGITNFCILYESFFLVIGPIYAIILWTCCWRRHDRFRLSCCRKYLE